MHGTSRFTTCDPRLRGSEAYAVGALRGFELDFRLALVEPDFEQAPDVFATEGHFIPLAARRKLDQLDGFLVVPVAARIALGFVQYA